MSDKIKKSPQIRFVGFTDTWEQRKAEEIFKTVSDKGHTELPVLSASQQLGMVRRDENGIDIQYDKKSVVNYKRVLPKQFVIHLRSFQGGFAHSSLEGITSPAYTIIDFKPENNQSDLFWKEIFTSKKFIKNLETVTYGIRDGRSISFNDFKTLLFTLPSYKEQEQIAGFFNDLNNFITLHQRELELLKETKKSLLQKMFPKDGANVPEIRFAGFTDAWEQRKLGEVGKTQSGIGFPEVEQGGTEGIPFFKVSDMNNEGNGNEMLTANNYVSDEQIAKKKWKPIETVPAVMFAKVGAAIMLNRKRLVRNSFLIDNNTMAYIFENLWDVNFGKTVFETINLPRYAQVGALPSYNGSDIESINVKLPSKAEQYKIGTFFFNLDNLITFKQRELNLLKNLKKSLLQQMFI